MKTIIRSFTLAAIAFSIISCGASKRSTQSLPPEHNGEMRVVGYIPSWRYDFHENLDWNALTHINIAFCNPDTLGVMQNPFRDRPEDFHRLVAKAHENGVKVIASLGGGGGGRNYPALIATEEGRRDFCSKIMDYVAEYRLDGVDLDLEEETGHILWQYYEPWVLELRRQCTEKGILLTTAVSTWFSDDITDPVFRCFDFVNIMAYDGPFDGHSTMELAETMANHYHTVRGVPAEDIVIGVPFYGRLEGGTWSDGKAYRDIVAENPRVWKKDYSGKMGFNGTRTMKQKSLLGRRYGGIMIWELSNDTDDERSLLRVIKKNLYKDGTAPRPVVD